MAHEIQTYRGRQAAWHHLGTVTNRYETTDQLLADPGFQYVVFKSQLRDGLGRPVDAWGTFRWNFTDKVAGNKDAATFLGVVGEDYTIMQHEEGFKTIDALMNTADHSVYETAGVLGAGEKVWALADLGLAAKVGDDVQKGYLLFSTGHDGSMSHSYRLCMTRVVCQNTLNAAISEKTRSKLVIRHTKNAMSRLGDAREALSALSDDVIRIEDKMNFLASRRLTRESVTSIFDRLFPKTKKDDGAEKETTRRTNIIGSILALYESNDNDAFPEQRGTSFNLLNAVTAYTDHERSTKDNQRAESAMFGSGDALKSRALDVIMETSKGLEIISRPQYHVGTGSTGSAVLDDVLSGMTQ